MRGAAVCALSQGGQVLVVNPLAAVAALGDTLACVQAVSKRDDFVDGHAAVGPNGGRGRAYAGPETRITDRPALSANASFWRRIRH